MARPAKIKDPEVLAAARLAAMPKGYSNLVKVSDKETGFTIYSFNLGVKICSMFFKDGSAKIFGYFHFQNETQRNTHGKNAMESMRANLEMKAKYRKERTQGRNLAVGDIMVSSWGYEQTNVDYYQVVELVGQQSVKVRRIAAKSLGGTGNGMADYCMPVKDKFIKNETVTYRVSYGTSIKISSYQTAKKWEGGKNYRSWYA